MRAVLTYHSIDESGSVISLSPAQFRRHVEWLAKGRVTVGALSDVVSSQGARDAGDNQDTVAITFDDGFANFAEHAAPVLKAHGMVSTVFVVTDHVGGDNRWGGATDARVPVMPLLDWDTLGSLAESGVEIGAHTRTHPRLPALAPAALEDELLGSAEVIASRIGRRPTTFAYPYGASDSRVEDVARRSFSVSCTTEYRALREREDSARVPRLDAWYFRTAGELESWGTATFRLRLSLRSTARRARRLLRPD